MSVVPDGPIKILFNLLVRIFATAKKVKSYFLITIIFEILKTLGQNISKNVIVQNLEYLLFFKYFVESNLVSTNMVFEKAYIAIFVGNF